MAGGPAGPEVGRVTVRVAPDSSKFDKDLEKQLKRKDDEAVKIPIRGELDKEQIEKEVDKIRLARLNIPVTVDRKQAREQINKVLEKPMRLKAVTIPVRVDRAQLRRAINEAASAVDNATVTIGADVDRLSARAAGREVAEQAQDAARDTDIDLDNVRLNERDLSEQIDSVLDDVREVDTRVRANFDESNWPDWARRGAEHFEMNVDLDFDRVPDEIQEILRQFDRDTRTIDLDIDTADVANAGRRLGEDIDRVTDELNERLEEGARNAGGNIGEEISDAIDDAVSRDREVDVDVDTDSTRLQDQIDDAIDTATANLRDRPILVQLDAEARLLRGKIQEAFNDIQRLREQGVDLQIEANTAPVLRQIRQVEDRLDVLSSQRATPTVQVRIQQEERRLRDLYNELERLRGMDVQPIVDLQIADAEAKAARLIRQLDDIKTRSRRIRGEVDIDVDTEGLNNALRRANTSLARGLSEMARTTGRLSQSLFQDLPNAMRHGIGGVSESLLHLSRAIDGIGREGGNSFMHFRKSLLSAAGAAAALSSIILRVGAITAGVSALGAGLYGAFALAASAISGLPALVGLLGPAVAVVAMGMDGIKRAAQQLKPEFDQLKKSVSDTFEQGLTPVFKSLKPLIASLEAPLDIIATAIINVASDMANLFNQQANADQLRSVLRQTAETINGMRPGIKDVVGSFLTLMNQPAAFQAWENAFNRFGAAFKENLQDTIVDGSLEKSFRSLGAVAGEVGEMIAEAFKSLTQMFAGGTGAGIATFLNDLSGFFQRFDWGRLGGAVGDVFTGLGETLRDVDPAVIEDITVAFEDLGALFRNADFQADLQKIIGNIDEFVAAITWLSDKAADIGAVVAGVIEGIGGENVAAGAAVLGIGLLLGKITKAFTGWWKGLRGISKGWKAADLIGDVVDGLDIDKEMKRRGKKKFDVGDLFDKDKKNLPKIDPGDLIARPLAWSDLIPDLIGTGAGLLGDLIGDLFFDPEAKIDLDGLKTAIETAIKDGFEGALSEAELDVNLTLSENAVTTLVDSVADGIRAQQDKISAAFAEAFAGASESAGEGLTGINEQINTAADTWAETVRTAFEERVNLAFAEGLAGLAEQVPIGMEPVNTALQEQFALLAETVRTGFAEQIRLAWDEGFVGLQEATTLGMTNLATAFTTAFTEQLVVAVQTGMEQLRVAYEAGFLTLQETQTTQFELINTGWLTFFTNLNTLVTDQMAILLETWTLGLTNLNTRTTEQLTLLQTAFSNALLAIRETFGVGFTEFVNFIIAEVTRMNTGAIAPMASFVAQFTTAMEFIDMTWRPWITGLVDFTCAELARLVECVRVGVEQIRNLFGAPGGEGGGGEGGGGLWSQILEGLRIFIEDAIENWTQFFATLSEIFTAWKDLFQEDWANGFETNWQSLQDFINRVLEAWRSFFEELITISESGIQNQVASFENGFATIEQVVQSAMQAIVAAVQDGMNQMVDAVQSGVDAAVAAAESGVDAMRAAGENMGQALADGLRSKVGEVRAAAAELAAAARSATANTAQIASPSKVFLALGRFMALGLALGMQRNEDAVARAARHMIEEAEEYARRIAEAFQNIGGDDIDVEPNVPNWDSAMRSGVIDSPLTALANGSPIIGSLTVQTPSGVTPKEMMDEVVFAMRKARRGGIYAR